ncbi:hypothetical protein MKQ68_14470 [Chitinophaga horti]|uniref:DUF1735 domain-containing protein n=1 Tax=Chitinophaga horti TaxID=2920382 RepID=A0ABY6IVA0_9BACT|nr:hypothetical protein [Chitinophaga horti]UYQ91294.1 hypothetical protein MKQ68_14470 [Chitinophaga horti]
MKKLFILSAVLLTTVMGCSKEENGDDKPVIKFKSYSVPEIPAGFQGNLVVTLDVADGDGDIEDTLFIQTNWTTSTTTLNYDPRRMPGIGAYKGTNLKAEVQLLLDNTYVIPNPEGYQDNDSIYFRIYVQDNSKNISDTIVTPPIRIYHR